MSATLTYRQLKEFVNRIDEQFLDQPAIIIQEEGSIAIEAAEIMDEEMVIYSDGEYDNIIDTKSSYEEITSHLFNDDVEFELKNTFSKGFPLMWEDISNSHNDKLTSFKVQIAAL